jgi:NAD-dependent SIR2 family protein deacetylase
MHERAIPPLAPGRAVNEVAATDAGIEALSQLLRGRRVAILTGAGVSTESGIPDYRSAEAQTRVRRPIQGPEFVRSAALRHRYWARAMAGWERFRSAEPGAAHHAIADLEARGVAVGVITQNVDRLHTRAGTKRVVELHGALAEVVCLTCGALHDRDDLQCRMRLDNPTWIDGPTPMAPDGDAELADDLIDRFVVPTCTSCGGALKPRVVFFGDNVAREVVDRAFALLQDAEVLLVAGTSLAVFSGYRFLRRAAERQMDIAIVNRGPVRGEEHASLKIERSTGDVLAAVARRI